MNCLRKPEKGKCARFYVQSGPSGEILCNQLHRRVRMALRQAHQVFLIGFGNLLTFEGVERDRLSIAFGSLQECS